MDHQEENAALRAELKQMRAQMDRVLQRMDADTHDASSAPASTPTPVSTPTPQTATSSPTGSSVYYGRPLSAKEQAYLDRLHSEQRPATFTASSSTTSPTDAGAPLHTGNVLTQEVPLTRFVQWLVHNWPMKVGGFFVVAAVGWFITYAAMSDILSPTGRVVLGYVFAALCIAFGTARAEKHRAQGNVFLIIGGAALLITTLGGIYLNVVTPTVGLFLMLISVGLLSLIALRQQSKALTVTFVCFGIAIPAFFFSNVDFTTIFLSLLILSVGTLWIVQYTQWRALTLLLMIATAFYSFGYFSTDYSSYAVDVTNLLTATLLTALFYGTNVATMLRAQQPTKTDVVIALFLGFLVWWWITLFTSDTFSVMLLVGAALLFAISSYMIFVRTARFLPTLVYGGVSIMLLAVATAIQFDGPILVTALAVEAAIGAVVALRVMRDKLSANVSALIVGAYAVPVMLSLPYLSEASEDIDALFAVFMMAMTALTVAIAGLRVARSTTSHALRVGRLFAYGGGIYTAMLVWHAAHFFIANTDVATFVALCIYTAVGVLFYVTGAREQSRPLMVVGGLLFGFVIMRVLFVEFWAMDMVMRIVTSFVLGLLLISTAFFRQSRKP